MDLQTIKLLSGKLLSPHNYLTITPDIEQRISIAIARLSYTLIATEDIKNMNYKKYFGRLIIYLKEHPISSKYMSEKAFVKFNIGLYQYYNNEKSNGIREIKRVITSLNLLECNELGDFLISEFKNRTGLSDL